MGTLREPYELSAWEDIVVPASGNIAEYFDEQKIAIIGSDTLDTPVRAYNVTLKEGINGEKTLTFEMLRKTKDSTGAIIDNPFLTMLANERKLKLRIGKEYTYTNDPVSQKTAFDAERAQEDTEEKWHDFVIKDVDETSDTRLNKYTAKEIFVNELGKNGYSTLLDTELENNYGTIIELSDKILDGSGWTINASSYSPTERIAQPLFVARLDSIITGRSMITESTRSIGANEYIYPLYDYITWDDTTSKWKFKPIDGQIQFLWKGNGLQFDRNDTNDDRLIIDDTFKYNYYIVANTISLIGDIQMTGLDGFDALQGNRIVKTINSHFDSVTNQYVNEYKVTNALAGRPVNTIVFGALETKYTTSSIVTNYLTNTNNFISNVAWLSDLSYSPYATVLPYPTSTDPTTWLNSNPINYLQLNIAGANRSVYNEGPSNTGARMALVQDKIYVVRIKGRMITKGAKVYGTNGANISTAAQPTLQVSLGTYSASSGYAIKTNSATINLTSGINTSTTDMNTRGYGNPISSASSRVKYSGIAADSAARVDEQRYVYVYLKANASTRASVDRMHLRIYNTGTSTTHDYNIEDVQCFDYVTDSSGVPIFLGDTPTADVQVNRNYYYIDSNKNPISLSPTDTYYTPVYKTGYQSVRHLDIKESNYFNNINSLAELFEVWVKFKIYHQKDGRLLLDATTKQPKKEIIYSQYAPNGDVINWAGFKYGINLKNIQRRRDSNSLATKVIVKNNNQEFAIDGMCSITRAHDNPTGENEIFNFDYYVNQGLLEYTQMLRDCYGMSSKDLGAFVKLRQINDKYTPKAKLLQSYVSEISIAEGFVESYKAAMDSCSEQIAQETWWYNEYYKSEKSLPADQQVQSNIKKTTILQLKAQLQAFTAAYNGYLLKVSQYTNKKTTTQLEIDDLIAQKKALKQTFYKKYARFIQEGTWADDKYVDDNLYYLDGVKIASVSAFPKASYNIDVFDISTVEGYAAYNFTIGSRTYIEDTEFFGWTLNDPGGQGATLTPFKMEVIVSERTRNLDDPDKSSLTVQNYKNQFEELFSKVAATTAQLQYESGGYGRAAAAILPTGEVQITTLEQAFANNAFTLANVKNQSVIWDSGRGIEITNKASSSEMLRLTSGGIFMTVDGGRTWINGISGAGINTNYLLAGQIDANKINIISNGLPIFRWDGEGISAFKTEGLEYNATQFVRFNQFGLFGTTQGSTLNEELNKVTYFDDKLKVIRDYSNFSLTWEGLFLQYQDGAVSLNPTNGVEVFNKNWIFSSTELAKNPYRTKPDGSEYQVNDKIPLVSIGKFYGGPTTPTIEVPDYYYGLRMRNKEGYITLQTTSVGNLWLKDLLTVGELNSSRFVGIDGSFKEIEGSPTSDPIVLYAGSSNKTSAPFSVSSLGKLKATSADITGKIVAESGSFTGTINATGGEFSGSVKVGNTAGINGSLGAQYAFWSGLDTSNEANIPTFSVAPDGSLYATQANIAGTINAVDSTFSGQINAQSGSFTGPIYFGNSDSSYIGILTDNPLFINIANGNFGVNSEGDIYGNSLMLAHNKQWSEIEPTIELWKQYNILINRQTSDNYIIEMFKSDTLLPQSERVFGVNANGDVYINGKLRTQGDLTFAGRLKSASGIMTIDGNEGSITVKTPAVDGWGIFDTGEAYFSNVTVRGKISSAIFEYDKKSSIGGELIVSPSIQLIELLEAVSTDAQSYSYDLSNLVNSSWINVDSVLLNIYGTEVVSNYNHPILTLDKEQLDLVPQLIGQSALPIGTQIISKSTNTNSITLSAKDPLGGLISMRGPSNLVNGDTLTTTTGIRYIRDKLNGNTINAGNHWVQLQVIDNNGTLISKELTATSSTFPIFVPTTIKMDRYTDGTSTPASSYISVPGAWAYLQLDLGGIHTDIKNIKVWHYYGDGRKYNHKLEVSTDGIKWFTIFDSEKTGAYTETSSGKTYNIINSDRTSVLIGNLSQSQLPTTAINYFGNNLGYGLYADNAYLTGKLYLPNAGVTDENNRYYKNQVVDGKQIRFWAGTSAADMEKAPFIVTHDGTLYASSGIFEGQVYATNSEFSGFLIAAGILIDSERTNNHFFVTRPFTGTTPTVDDYILDINEGGLNIWEGGLNIFSDYYAGWRGDNKIGAPIPYYGYSASSNPNPWPIFTVADESISEEYIPRITMAHNHTWFRNGQNLTSTRTYPGSIRFTDLTLSETTSNYNNVESLLWSTEDKLKIGRITVNDINKYGLQSNIMHFSNDKVDALTIQPIESTKSGQQTNTSITTTYGFFKFGNSVQVSQETDGIIFTYIGQ